MEKHTSKIMAFGIIPILAVVIFFSAAKIVFSYISARTTNVQEKQIPIDTNNQKNKEENKEENKNNQTQVETVADTITRQVIATDGRDVSIPQTGKAILANLTTMKIDLYVDGQLQTEFTILAKGTEGSRYETPVGNYKVLTKEESHKVSIGDIYMPYSMQFFGNFFIHGRPYYGNGVPLRDGDSGGCIRLATEDAEKVFDFADYSTPVFIVEPNAHDQTETVTAFSSSASHIQELPEVSAHSYIVADIQTGFVFAEKNATEKLSVGTLSNLMTAVISEEINRDDHKVTAHFGDLDSSLTDGLRESDTFTSTQLLNPLLLQKGDASALSIAVSAGPRTFLALMNIKSSALNMLSTHFVSPAEATSTNISTASDLFRLVDYIYTKHSYLAKATLRPSSSLEETDSHGAYLWSNTHSFLSNDTLGLISDGQTLDSEQVSSAVFTVPLDGKNRPVAIVVLGSRSKEKDTQTLLEWVKTHYGFNQ